MSTKRNGHTHPTGAHVPSVRMTELQSEYAARRFELPNKKRASLLDLSNFWAAIRCAGAGLRVAWRHESAFRREVLLTLLLVPLAFRLGRNWVEITALLVPLAMLLVSELLNTGIEAAIDRIGTEHHDLSRIAKDVGAAAVLVSFMLLCTVWSLASYSVLRS